MAARASVCWGGSGQRTPRACGAPPTTAWSISGTGPDRPVCGHRGHFRAGPCAARGTCFSTRLKPVEITFTPVDNPRLANLCGVLDENLRQIETALDVNIARRGERFAVTGKADQIRIATQVLRSFYERAQNGLSLEDVQLGLIEAASRASSVSPKAAGTDHAAPGPARPRRARCSTCKHSRP